MKNKFNHEKLSVYQKSINFVASLNNVINSKQHPFAVYDQISRASESIVMNLVQANNMPLSDARLNRLDYSLGSTLECAACIDILKIWDFISDDYQKSTKSKLQEICKMLIGLKKSVYNTPQINEQQNEYGSSNNKVFFNHEKMQVYIKSIEYISLLKSMYKLQQMNYKEFSSLDKHSVSIPLNIAEGNGRYSSIDHRRFLNIAMTSTLKASASLDLTIARNIIPSISLDKEKECLKEIFSMLYKLNDYWKKMEA